MTDRDESIALSWTPRSSELADAQLARDREIGGSSARGIIAVLMALIAAPMLLSPYTLPAAIAFYVVAFLLVSVSATARIMRRRWATLIAGNPAQGDAVDARLDSSGVRTDSARMSISRKWSVFTSWSDTADAVVFATSDTPHAAVLVIPLRAASGPDNGPRSGH